MLPGDGVDRKRSGARSASVPAMPTRFVRSMVSATSKIKNAWNAPDLIATSIVMIGMQVAWQACSSFGVRTNADDLAFLGVTMLKHRLIPREVCRPSIFRRYLDADGQLYGFSVGDTPKSDVRCLRNGRFCDCRLLGWGRRSIRSDC